MRELKECIGRLNSQGDEVRATLLLGESGVGKTYIANVIAMHRCWVNRFFLKTEKEPLKEKEITDQMTFYVRAKGAGILKASGDPFREVPLPMLEGDLARSWLFGHLKGSFTGAKETRHGFLGDEDVTDVLLDEIGYASIEMQRSLLQVIQSGKFYKVGSTKQETTEARLIFATNQDMKELVREHKFQEDLWWRLTDHVLHIPALRERRSEIGIIVRGILESLNKEHIGGDGSGFLHLSKADFEWAESHMWDGNIRELEKTIQRWFFYRGTKSLQAVWTQIAPFIPRRQINEGDSLRLDESRLRVFFTDRLRKALSGEIVFSKPDEILNELVDPVQKQTARILVSCIDDLRPSAKDLTRMFRDYALSSTRSWMARNRN
jgi:DNA-binding NtrC family response regulator